MKQSLSTKVLLPLILLLALGSAITAKFVDSASTAGLQDNISSNQSDEAKQSIDKIDRYLYERTLDLQSLAARQQIQDFLTLPAAERPPATAALLTRQMDDFKNLSGSWSEVSIVDLQGIQPLGYSLQNLQASLAKQPAVLKLFSGALSGNSGYSDALTGVNGSAPIMLFMVPVHSQQDSEHTVKGVVVGVLAWQTNLDILRDIQNAKATLLNQNGISLGDNMPGAETDVLALNFSKTQVYKKSQNNISSSGIFPGIDDPKNNYLTSYVREKGYLNYRGNNWLLVLATPESTAFKSIKHFNNLLIIYSGGFFVLTILLILIVLKIIVLRPLASLKEVTGRLSRGDFSLRTTVRSNDELGRLSKDFNEMADKMQATQIGLTDSNNEAQQARRTTQAILENLPIGVLVVEAPGGKPIMMNRVAERISGISSPLLKNLTSYTEVYKLEKEDGSAYPEAERPLVFALKTGKSILKEDAYIKTSHGPIAVRLFASPIKLADGSFHAVVSLLEDISDSRNLERSREEFFSIASHELRTPLTAIRGNTSLIQEYFKPALKDPELSEMVNDIHESSVRLIDIVNDFLDSSRLEQSRVKYNFADINIYDIAESAIKEYAVTGSRRKIHIEVIKPQKPLPLISADKDRTKQVIINLVGNALKFTAQGSIKIQFQVIGKYVKTLITDTGQGMDTSAQDKLFRKFEQTGSKVLTRDSVSGTGLGLYISKMIVEQMKGTIKLERSELDKGSTFSFSLPIVEAGIKKDEGIQNN